MLLHSSSRITQGKTHGMCNTPGGEGLGETIDRPKNSKMVGIPPEGGSGRRKYEKYKIPYYQANENIPLASFKFGFSKRITQPLLLLHFLLAIYQKFTN